MSVNPVPPCGYPDHRHTDWHLVGSTRLVCGVCHPPAERINAVYLFGGQSVEPQDRAPAHVATGVAHQTGDES